MSNDQLITRRTLLRVVAWATLLWGVVVTGALFGAATTVRRLAAGEGMTISVGPLSLAALAKVPEMSGGFTLSFTLQAGMLALGAICLAVQSVAMIGIPAFLRYRKLTTVVHRKGK